MKSGDLQIQYNNILRLIVKGSGGVSLFSGMERWNGMELNSGMTTPTERGFVTTYTHCICNYSQIMGKPVAVVKKR
jgi:hypothetical protein